MLFALIPIKDREAELPVALFTSDEKARLLLTSNGYHKGAGPSHEEDGTFSERWYPDNNPNDADDHILLIAYKDGVADAAFLEGK